MGKSTVLVWLECKEETIVDLLSISRPPTPLHHNQPRNGFHDNLINQTINSLQLEGEMVQKRYGHKNLYKQWYIQGIEEKIWQVECNILGFGKW